MTENNLTHQESKFFVMFGDVPENEISTFYDSDIGGVAEEHGVSCYDFVKVGLYYHLLLPSLNPNFALKLHRIFDLLEFDEITAYLIEATQVGTGSFGEPVVKNVKMIRELQIVVSLNDKSQSITQLK